MNDGKAKDTDGLYKYIFWVKYILVYSEGKYFLTMKNSYYVDEKLKVGICYSLIYLCEQFIKMIYDLTFKHRLQI